MYATDCTSTRSSRINFEVEGSIHSTAFPVDCAMDGDRIKVSYVMAERRKELEQSHSIVTIDHAVSVTASLPSLIHGAGSTYVAPSPSSCTIRLVIHHAD